MQSTERIQAVKRMQDYIETHLGEPITLNILAGEAGYSPWHAARIFKEVIGKAPFDYIRYHRLSGAAERLSGGGEKVVDVAFDFVFGSHETFTRAFSRQFGMTPKQFAKHTPPIKRFLPCSAKDYYLTLQKGEEKMSDKKNTVFVQVVDRPKRRLILKRGIKASNYYEYCEEAGCDVWDKLSEIKEALYEPIGMWLPSCMRTSGTAEYAQGVEVPLDYSGDVPDGFEIIELPACKMMVFQGAPYDDDKFETAIDELWEVMKSYDPKLYGFSWADEDAPRFQLVPLGYRGYIEARPVRAL